jgi:hypothetical protein
MANFTFQTYIVTMLLNVITSTKVNIYILKLDIDHNDNVLFSNEKDSADYNSFNHIQYNVCLKSEISHIINIFIVKKYIKTKL